MSRNCVIVTDSREYSSNPTILNLIHDLNKPDTQVFIISPPQVFETHNSKVEKIYFPLGSHLFSLWSFKKHLVHLFHEIFNSLSFLNIYWNFKKNFNACRNDFKKTVYILKKSLSLMIKKRLIFRPHFLVSDEAGLSLSRSFTLFSLFPKITYLSFELTFEDECHNEFDKWHRFHSSGLMRFVSQYLIQDETRRKLLVNENGYLRNCNFHLVPVSSRVVNFVRKAPKSKPSAIFSGSLTKCMGIEYIINHLDSSKNSISVELHTHRPDLIDAELKNLINKLNDTDTIIHLKPFENITDYYSYLSQFHCAFCLYYGNTEWGLWMGKNIEYIGLSSGKFSTFMMLGIPAIVRNKEPFSSLIKKYEFGVAIETPNEISSAIIYINQNFNYLSKNAKDLYTNILAPPNLSVLNN